MTAGPPDQTLAATMGPAAASAARRAGPARWRGLAVGGAIAGLGLFTFLRAVGWEAAVPVLLQVTPYASLPLLLAFTPYAAAVAVVLAAVALARRMRGAAVVALVLLAVHAAWLLPRVTAEPAPAPGQIAPGARLRVMTANVYADRVAPDDLVAAVLAERPDVLALQETPPEVLAAADGAGLRRLLPYRVSRAGRPGHGGAIYANRPLEDAGDPLEALGRGLANPRASLDLSGRSVTVQSVHTNPPMPLGVEAWREDLRTLGDAAARTGGPLIAIGDYNASADHRSFRALLAAGGLRDAHDARGRGLVRTWPIDKGWRLPAFVHLDHVLVSRHLAVVGVHERTLPGTDHRAVIADLALVGEEPAS